MLEFKLLMKVQMMTTTSGKFLVFCIAACLHGLAAPVRAEGDTDYLTSFPSADRVAMDFTGRSDRETAARRAAALQMLASAINGISDGRVGRGQGTPAEQQLVASYANRYIAIIKAEIAKADPNCQGNDCDKSKTARCGYEYTLSKGMAREVMDRYFPANFVQMHNPRLSRAGTVWRDALQLPSGTTALSLLSPEMAKLCAGESGGKSALSWLTEIFSESKMPSARTPGSGSFLASLTNGLAWLLLSLLVLGLAWRIPRLRYFTIRRANKAALAEYGGTLDVREKALLDAFDDPDHTFRYAGANRNAVHKMRFTLLRTAKSFRRGDLESLRFAYMAFNRGVIDNEKFNWFRFSALWGRGTTDPSEWKFLGLFGRLQGARGAIDKARAAVANFAEENGGNDIEAQALASLQGLVARNSGDSLWRDMQRRFVDGTYWLTSGELRRSAFSPSSSPYSLVFGKLDGTDTDVVFAGDGSVITIAPPGSGKTQCNVFPNLLRWPGPAVVLDVKGEIHDGTAAWRAANVGPVIKFSPLDPAHSACFNPLTSIRGETVYLWEDARFLASMMIVPTAKDPFWEDKAREILTAIIADVVFWNRPEDRPMSKVLSLVNRNGWIEFVDRLRKNPESATMRDEGSNLAQMELKTLDGALQTAKASLSAWVGERIAQITAKSDWSPLDLRGGANPTIYVCVKPNEIDAYLSLLRVVIAMHIRALTSTKVPPRDSAPILFVLDELPRLKHMPPVEEALEVGRGYGIKLWMFAQSIGQMRTAYPNADGMMGSCAVRTFMNPSLQDGTAKMLAEQIGYRKGEEHGGKDKVAQGNQEFVVDPTQLAGADFKDLQIVMGVGTKPAKVRKQFAYADPELAAKMKLGGTDRGQSV